MVKIFCAVVGKVGSVFSVRVKEGKTVEKLKKVIIKNRPTIKRTDTDELRLFLARKDNAWLSDDDNLTAVLQSTYLDSSYIAMSCLSGKLTDPAYFGPNISSTLGERVIHVLVVVSNKPLETRQDWTEEEDKAELSHKATKSIGAKGPYEHSRLDVLGKISDIPSLETGTAFFSDKDQKKAEAFTKETDFFAFITSKFNDLVGPDMVFVNSENYPWLSQSSDASTNTKFKPDGFMTHVGMYRKPKKESPKQRGTAFRFGTADKQLYDCVILFECKLEISLVAFGQVIVYLENLSPAATAYAVLFDRCRFWLIESYKGEVVKVEKSTWVTKGSQEYLQNFIVQNTSPWVERLTNACSSLNVAVVEGSAFLGRGTIGCVFKVTRNGETLALKIVERDSARRLYDQEEALRNAQSTGLTISPIGEICEILVGGIAEAAALLLSPAGTPFPPPKTQQQVQRLFRLLWQLHTDGFAHGRPRVSNVIVSGKKLLWIGLVTARKVTSVLKASDANILVRSFLRLRHDAAVDPGLKQLINNYGAISTRENIEKLANKAWSFSTQ